MEITEGDMEITEGDMEITEGDMEITEGDFRYSIENEKATIIRYFGDNANLIIPESFREYEVTGIGPDTFDCPNPTRDSVTSTGKWCPWSSNLETLKIPNSVTSIAAGIFAECENLKKIEFKDDHPVYSFSKGALFDKTQSILYAYLSSNKKKSYKIPDSVTHIAESAFGWCPHLKTIEIPNSVISIGNYAFEYCNDLKTIEIPDSVVSIGVKAFFVCARLTSVKIGNSVRSIGYSTFEDCTGLTSIEIGNSVASIGEATFLYTYKLTQINIAKNHPVYSLIGGVLFDKKQNMLHTYFPSNKETSYAIPDFVISIGESAFESCHKLETLKIPNSVTSIGDLAFYDCDFTLCVEKGSYAHKYALEKDIDFVLE